ncbi:MULTISPECIES: glycine--tRNA ligase subunit beta [unclassified Thioalkalivibrio]|uniref:glycine--tRNA ligase subunit beta n=1 Tax=unclassified Thioalkalivibrio TaxID=2621013 RepID=UPI00035D8276|nr:MULTISPECIES: glycine--tRNA ligase subunit beta [unclassified Thioalkalivibrio]
MAEARELLIELGTEELPPAALPRLRDALADGLATRLREAGLEPGEPEAYATPRRLAVLFPDVPGQQPDQLQERRGPAVAAAFDDAGEPTKAVLGFARSCGVEVERLERETTDKGEYLVFRQMQPGRALGELLPEMLEAALEALPTPKRMRWGSSRTEFVRPAHWLVVLHGTEVLEMTVLEQTAGRATHGHRFHQPGALELKRGNDYAERLRSPGFVEPSFEARRENILAQVHEQAKALGGRALVDADLLDEVTALVEWPVALTGGFDPRFLDVPQEALISTMQDNQKYFPVVDEAGRMQPHFIVISNIESRDPHAVRDGNERVLRPRFADAEFFWQQDRKKRLEERLDALDSVVFEKRLGTLRDKSVRLEALMQRLAGLMGLDAGLAARAARLAKCDLVTQMVFEFTELQGTMGRYYALHDREDESVAAAIEQHYWPRQSGSELPGVPLAQALALADRLDTLVGIFAIGKQPTGTKDPFALRRAALGLVRILVERELPLALTPLLQAAAEPIRERVPEADQAVEPVREYILERLRGYLLEQGQAHETIEAVAAVAPDTPLDFVRRVRAVSLFRERPEAEALAAANKRIHNLLRKAGEEAEADLDPEALALDEERQLYQGLQAVRPGVEQAVADGDYLHALGELAGLRDRVDTFFDQVMVMAEDAAERRNRLALLRELRRAFETVADIGRLATG